MQVGDGVRLSWESLGLASALRDEAENWPMNRPWLLLCWRDAAANNEARDHKKNNHHSNACRGCLDRKTIEIDS